MANMEILKEVGVLPSILYFGGWIFIAILILAVLYHIFSAIIN